MALLRVWLPLLLLSVTTVNAADFELLVPRYNQTGPGPEDYECISERAPDYYGIGVRLGVYFSWWTAWVANAALEDEIFGSLDQNAVFLFANIIALVRCTITKVLTQLDCLVMIHLATGSIFGVLSVWGYRTCSYTIHGPKAAKKFGGFGTHFRLLLCSSVSAFSVWFWYRAVMPGSKLLNNDVGPCREIRTFMFGNVKADGGVRIFYLICAIAATMFFCSQALAAALPGYVRIVRFFTMSMRERYETLDVLTCSTGMNYFELRRLYYGLRLFNFIFLIWSMILVEFTLNYNHVKEVLGPGGRVYFPSQLIPMIIGAFTFCRVVFLRYKQSMEVRHEHLPAEDASVLTPLKRIDSGKDIFKILKPLTYVARPVQSTVPDDGERDERMQHEHSWVRVLVSIYPWLSLLPRWNSATEKKGPRPQLDAEKRSDSDTVRGSPSPGSLAYKVDFTNALPPVDDFHQVLNRFGSNNGKRRVDTVG